MGVSVAEGVFGEAYASVFANRPPAHLLHASS